MASIEQAISALFDPSQPQHIKQSAMDLTELAKKDPEFYKFAMQKVSELNLDSPNSLNYLFWYLQALEEVLNKFYSSFPLQVHTDLHRFLSIIVASRQDLLQKHYGILNKFALLYVRVIQVDFPEIWPQAFQVLIERVPSGAEYVKLFLAVMKTFSEEFVEELGYLTQEQLRRSNTLKDAIKDHVLGSAAEIWKQILNSTDLPLASATLQVIVHYITWIPLEVSLNFFNDFIRYLGNTETQIPALQCIDSLVNKKMSPQKKFEVIQKLNLIQFIQEFNFATFDMLSDVPKTMASLVDSLGENLLDIEQGNEFIIVLECALKCLENEDIEISRMVFGMISKFIRILKLKENLQPPQVISEGEAIYVSRIRMILMKRAQFPKDFEHVGPENSDEEDQFYKYRAELVDIFKNTLDLPGSKEVVLDELETYIINLKTSSTAEQIELPLYLIFNFAEKVTDLGSLLKTPNKYTQLIGTIIKFPIMPHKIVLRMYFENLVRYSAFFEAQEHSEHFAYALSQLLQQIQSQNHDIKKHAIYMLYRLAIKSCSCLVKQVEIVLQSIISTLGSSLEPESTSQLYKSIGLVISNKNINPQVQFPLFSNLCDVIISSVNKDSVNIFTDVLSGFSGKLQPELRQKLKQTVECVLAVAFQCEKTNDSIRLMCLLLQKLIDTLENESALYIYSGLEFLITAINMETVDLFFNVISNCCHKISGNLAEFIPVEKLRALLLQIIQNVTAPTETITDLSQQAIAVRRCLVKTLDVLLISFPSFFSFPEVPQLITYISGICCNFIESSSPKIALALLNRFVEKVVGADPGLPLSSHIIGNCFEVSIEILTRRKVQVITPEVSQALSELINLHRAIFVFFKRFEKTENFCEGISRCIQPQDLQGYLEMIRKMPEADQKTAHEILGLIRSLFIGYLQAPKNN